MRALDGVRGIAVAAVVLNHARPGALRGGWLGVDVFFVLSGYLITSLLLDERARGGRTRLRRFYARRARRLLPALFLLLIAVAIAAHALPSTPGFDDLRGDGAAALAYVANWHFIAVHASYFDAASPSPLRHLWSLGIEEQFYLVWPCVLLLVLRRASRTTLGVTAAVLAVASAVWMAVRFGNGAGITRVYFGTDTHAHGLLIGCALAALTTRATRIPYARTLGALALGGIAVAMATLNGTSAFAYRGGIFAVGLLVGLLVVTLTSASSDTHIPQSDDALRSGGPARWVLERRPLVGLGRISYGVYLWHWPVLLVATASRMHVSGWPLVAVQVGLTIAIATASFVLVEQPVLRGWPAGSDAWLVGVAGLTASATAIAVLAPSSTPYAAAQHAATTRSATHTLPTRSVSHGVRRVLVIGDSVAYTLVPGLTPFERSSGLFFVSAAETGCPLDIAATALRDGSDTTLLPKPTPACQWPTRWPPVVDRVRPALVVALWGLWDLYDPRIGTTWLPVGSPQWTQHMEQVVNHAVDLLTVHGAHVVILTTPYNFGAEPARVNALNALFRAVAAQRPQQVSVVDIQPLIHSLKPERWDSVHFTDAGAAVLGRALVPIIARVH